MPSTLTLAKLKAETGWPGLSGLASWEATGAVLGWYLLSLVLQTVLPGTTKQGTKLATGGKLTYKFNSFTSALFTFALLAAGTVWKGANWSVWTFIWDNYVQIFTANLLIAYVLATFVYIRSFSVVPGNAEKRELATGGHSGNMLYDWFIGRELNPRITVPVFGTIDIKVFMEMRPGLLGWIVLDLAFMAHQYATYGFVTDSMVLITSFQMLYVMDSYYMEPSMLTTMDITTDGFGFMLAFGDVGWVPFIYSQQARYLATYPLSLGLTGCAGVLAILGVGYWIFRSSNNEKNRFRTNPNDPRVAHLKYITTASGSRLITSGWWGTARHINYLGDWIMSWSYSLPTGVAGYVVSQANQDRQHTLAANPGEQIFTGTNGEIVYQNGARGWGMLITYFYVLYFAVLLIHRELRDEEKCKMKYREDWKRYKEIVRWKILPGVY